MSGRVTGLPEALCPPLFIFNLLFCLLFGCACEILAPQPGIEPMPPALEVGVLRSRQQC